MMMYSVGLYGDLARETGQGSRLAPAGRPAARVVAGAARGDPPPERLGAHVRPADGDRLGSRGAGEVPADVDRRRAGGGLPALRRLPRPEPADVRAGRRGPPARRRDRDADDRHRHRGARRARGRGRHRPGPDRVRRGRQRGGHVRARDRPDGRRLDPDHPVRPPVRRHRAVRAGAAGAADAARPGQPHLLPHRGRRPRDGRLRAQPGGVGARRHPGRVRGAAAGRGLGPDGGADDERDPARARRSRRCRSSASSTAPRRSRRTPSSSSASPRCRASGSPPASARTASPAPAASARRWPSGSSTASRSGRCGRSTSAASVPPTARSASRSRAPTRRCRSTTTSSTRARRSRRPGRCACRPPTPSRRTRRRVRREVGLGARQLVRVERGGAATRRCGRAAGRARTGRPRSPPRRPPPAPPPACSTSRASRSSRCVGPGALDLLQRLCANDVATPVGRVTYTQMLNERGGIECDLSVIRTGRGSLPARHRHGLRHARPALDRAPCAPRRLGPRHRRDREPRVLRPLGPARARRSCSRLTKTSLAHADFPYMSARADRRRRRALPRGARHLRGRARLGAVLPRRVRRRAVGHAVRRRRGATAWCRAATARSTRCGSRRATAPGRPTSRPTRRRTRPGLGVRGEARQGRRLHRPRGGRSRSRAAGPAGHPARLPRAGRPARDRPRLGARAARRTATCSGRVTTGGYGFAVAASIAWAWVPAEAAEPGHAARGRHLRRLGRRGGARRAAVRPERASGSAPTVRRLCSPA